MISNNVEASEKPLNAANSADFRRIYNETMILLFKVSWRIVNDEDAAEEDEDTSEDTTEEEDEPSEGDEDMSGEDDGTGDSSDEAEGDEPVSDETEGDTSDMTIE